MKSANAIGMLIGALGLVAIIAGCQSLLPHNQETDEALVSELERLRGEQRVAGLTIADLEEARALAAIDLAAGVRDGADAALIGELQTEVDDLDRRIAKARGVLKRYQTDEQAIERDRDTLRSQDAGEQFGGWSTFLLGLIGLGVPVLNSRTRRGAVDEAVTKTKEILHEAPSRAASAVDALGTELGKVQGWIQAFERGMQSPAPIPQPPVTYPPPSVVYQQAPPAATQPAAPVPHEPWVAPVAPARDYPNPGPATPPIV